MANLTTQTASGVAAGALPMPTSHRPPESPQRRQRVRLRSRRVLVPVLLAFAGFAAYFAYTGYRDAQLYVSTDNAQITGTPIQIGATSAGRVVRLYPTVGSAIHSGALVAQLALPSQVGIAQNGQPKLDFLGTADTRIDVRSPVDGTVIAVPTGVGASVSAGQAIATVIDPSALWVNANVDEDSVGRVKPGQPVTVHVDAINADLSGRVEAITPATASTFSLLPQANTTGTFTKVVQLVPVRIAVDLSNRPVLLGSSAEIKIQVGH